MRTRVSLLAAIALAVGTAGAVHATAPPAQLDPAALHRARVIRAEVSARYGVVPGRRLAVTESTSTGVVESLTLVTDWLTLPRVVPAHNGLYFAVCTARARCPYPVRPLAWQRSAFLPRRIALEVAARAFLETTVSLVVVLLPTARPTWVVFERDELSAATDIGAVRDRLSGDPSVVDAFMRQLVFELTQPRLYVPLPILPPPDGTIVAAHVGAL
jgi:hypothetical protein